MALLLIPDDDDAIVCCRTSTVAEFAILERRAVGIDKAYGGR
jgi:hypothetical protein